MVRQKPIACLHLALFCISVIVLLAISIVATTTVNIGGLFPLTTAGDRASGRQNLAAVLLAIDQVNNKSDGIHDTLLENYNVRAGVCSFAVNRSVFCMLFVCKCSFWCASF